MEKSTIWFIVIFVLIAAIVASLVTLFVLRSQKTTNGSQGPKGDKGEKGEKGDQGIQGVPGSSNGATGSQGAQGFQGFQGFQGIAGLPGLPGTQGGLLLEEKNITFSEDAYSQESNVPPFITPSVYSRSGNLVTISVFKDNMVFKGMTGFFPNLVTFVGVRVNLPIPVAVAQTGSTKSTNVVSFSGYGLCANKILPLSLVNAGYFGNFNGDRTSVNNSQLQLMFNTTDGSVIGSGTPPLRIGFTFTYRCAP